MSIATSTGCRFSVTKKYGSVRREYLPQAAYNPNKMQSISRSHDTTIAFWTECADWLIEAEKPLET